MSMKLILGFGGGGGYYPYTQKPADYQPYRPVYLFRGPPPDAGFSYGLFEDPDLNRQYYADMGLEIFSPFTGKPANLLYEVEPPEDRKLVELYEDQETDMELVKCPHCSSDYRQNIRHHMKGRDQLFCHRCGGKLQFK